MSERTWDGVRGIRPNKSSIGADESQSHVPDPNNEREKDAVRYWIKFADFYQMPHITYFDSVRDLVDKLENIKTKKLHEISDNMKLYNAMAMQSILDKWKTILAMINKK